MGTHEPKKEKEGVLMEDDDKCDECGEVVPEECFFGAYEDRGECHGAPSSEYICYGYKCPNCGHKEEF